MRAQDRTLAVESINWLASSNVSIGAFENQHSSRPIAGGFCRLPTKKRRPLSCGLQRSKLSSAYRI
jgi:hypothetical protein